eukprot:GHVN01101284.1.p2 GENE.GHVN01101284.1~~GHVN01101284.1.p2  ORF type:complete len:101 (-),score=4.66 GHVN01101284.1:3-305(-)
MIIFPQKVNTVKGAPRHLCLFQHSTIGRVAIVRSSAIGPTETTPTKMRRRNHQPHFPLMGLSEFVICCPAQPAVFHQAKCAGNKSRPINCPHNQQKDVSQ